MKILKAVIFIILPIAVVAFPFLAFSYLIPVKIDATDNLIAVIGLFIAYYTFWATIGIALFIYWLQERNAKKVSPQS